MTYEPSEAEKALLEKLLGIKNELKQLVASNDELVGVLGAVIRSIDAAKDRIANEIYMLRTSGRPPV